MLRQGPTAPPGDRKSLNSGVDWIVTSDEPRRFRRGSTRSKSAIRHLPDNRDLLLLQSRIAFKSSAQPVSLISLWLMPPTTKIIAVATPDLHPAGLGGSPSNPDESDNDRRERDLAKSGNARMRRGML